MQKPVTKFMRYGKPLAVTCGKGARRAMAMPPAEDPQVGRIARTVFGSVKTCGPSFRSDLGGGD
jgi:hypothetical protein